MDMLSMLMNSRIMNLNGDEIGEVIGVHLAMGKMSITTDIESSEDESPDDGDKEDIPDDDASKMEFPKIIAMGKKAKKDGTNG